MSKWAAPDDGTHAPPVASVEKTRQSHSTDTDSEPSQSSVHLLTRPCGGGRPDGALPPPRSVANQAAATEPYTRPPRAGLAATLGTA